MPPRSVTAEMVATCKRMWSNGRSKRQIAKELACSWETVRKILRGEFDDRERSERCSGCGGIVMASKCKLCEIRDIKLNGAS